MTIGVIDIDIGNIGSVFNMLKRLGVPSFAVTKPEDLVKADRIILPGVGHFSAGMKKLNDSGLAVALTEAVQKQGKLVLGICLGMQLLGEHSDEGDAKGLGWIKAKVKRFDTARMQETQKIPHIGWTDVVLAKPSPLASLLESDPRFYFVHSYHMVCDDPADVLFTAEYGYPFTAAVAHDNVFGVQFHPEKSHVYGMKLLEGFTKLP